jgi:hypothetical protein
VDPLHRGPLYLQGTPSEGGAGVVHIELQAPIGGQAGLSGSATLVVDLNEEP